MSRAYTAKELDELRTLVEHKYLFGSYRRRPGNVYGRPYQECEKVKVVEERVRTHMIAGHTAAELLASEDR